MVVTVGSSIWVFAQKKLWFKSTVPYFMTNKWFKRNNYVVARIAFLSIQFHLLDRRFFQVHNYATWLIIDLCFSWRWKIQYQFGIAGFPFVYKSPHNSLNWHSSLSAPEWRADFSLARQLEKRNDWHSGNALSVPTLFWTLGLQRLFYFECASLFTPADG